MNKNFIIKIVLDDNTEYKLVNKLVEKIWILLNKLGILGSIEVTEENFSEQ